MNLTPQRVAIYRTLLESTDHPTPEVLFSRVQPQMASLSLATIYKTLEALTRLHLVAELPATGQSRRFDANMARHQHLVCTGCGLLTDHRDAKLERVEAPRELDGFVPHSVHIHIHGLCRDCARGKTSKKKHPKQPATEGRTR